MFNQKEFKAGACKSTRRRQFNSDDEWSASDYERPKKPKRAAKQKPSDANQPEKERCKICLEYAATKKNMKDHVKKDHPDEFKGNEKKPAKFWVHQKPYTGTPGNDNNAAQAISENSPDSPREPVKQASSDEEVKEDHDEDSFAFAFKEVLKEKMDALSQDDMENYSFLVELADKFDLKGAAAFLKSNEARAPLSNIRSIVATGAQRLTEIPLQEVAKIIFAAIMLGEGTLELF